MEELAKCNKCGVEFPRTLEFFGKNKRRKDGMELACRVCKGGNFIKQVKEGYKICNKCGRELPATLEYFNLRKNTPCGLSSACKDCRNAYSKKYRQENKEKVTEYSKKYYQEKRLDPEFVEKQLNWAKAWIANNQERVKERKKQYRKENKDAIKKYTKKYNEENRERNRINCKEYNEKNKQYISKQRKQHREENREEIINREHKKRAKIRNLEHSLTTKQWRQCLKHFNNSCAYCGLTDKENMQKYEKALEQDHFIPIANNGEYTINNIIPACRGCNASKRDRDFFEWYPQQEYYSKERENKILKHLNYTDDGKQQLIIAI